ncbi:MAG: NADPH:quinone oxidoreductase family protein [Rhodospirillaceae bacterium]|nr:NADPH:quinone oxidoreductase family protein [Rhodospirillaceae bacterium]
MRAVVCEKLGLPSDLVVRDVPDPPEPGPGEIKVALAARGAQFVDVLMAAGEYQTKPPLPFIPGSEAAGEVIAVGPDVADFAVGDKVMTRHSPGAFAEMATISTSAALPVPDGMDLIQAAGFRSAYTTAYHALVQRGRLQPGEVLLVHGAAGGIGLAAVQVGKILGATVIATAGNDEKLAAVKANGADHIIDLTVDNPRDSVRDQVKAATGGGVDVVLEIVGGQVFEGCLRALNWRGTLVVVGFTSGEIANMKTNYVLLKGVSVTGINWSNYRNEDPAWVRRVQDEIFDMCVQKKINMPIQATFPMEDVVKAFNIIRNREIRGKIVIRMGDEG